MRFLLIVIVSLLFVSDGVSQTTTITKQHSHYIDSIHRLLLGTWFWENDTTDVFTISWDTIDGRHHEIKETKNGEFSKDISLIYSRYHYYVLYNTGYKELPVHCIFNTVVPLNSGRNDTVLNAIYVIDLNQLQFAASYRELHYKRKK